MHPTLVCSYNKRLRTAAILLLIPLFFGSKPILHAQSYSGRSTSNGTHWLHGQRDLVYASQNVIQELSGCTWFQRCSPYSDSSNFKLLKYPRFARWSELLRVDDDDTHWDPYGESPDYLRSRTLRKGELSYELIFWENESFAATSGVALALMGPKDTSSKGYHDVLFLALYRIWPNGLEEEYRPLNSQPELPLHQYRRIQILRRQHSTHHEDIAHWEMQYLDNQSMRATYGVEWGARIDALRSSQFLSNYTLENPSYFFVERPTDWLTPQWDRSFKAAAYTTTSSWSPTSDRTFYIFRENADQAIRIVETDADGRFVRSFDYLPDHQLVIRAAKPIQQTVTVTSSLCDLILYPNIAPGRLAAQFAGVSSDSELIPIEVSRSLYSNKDHRLIDPEKFFIAQGHALTAWRESFEAAPGDIGRWDRSWSDGAGNRYQIIGWDAAETTAPGDWCLLRYRNESLAEVRYFDDTWLEHIYTLKPVEPHATATGSTPSGRGDRSTNRNDSLIPRLLRKLQDSPSAIWAVLIISAIVVGGLLIIIIKIVRRKKVRRKRLEGWSDSIDYE